MFKEHYYEFNFNFFLQKAYLFSRYCEKEKETYFRDCLKIFG